MSTKGLPSDLIESQLPPNIEESVSRMNAVLMVCATSEVLENEDETENTVEYYRDLMNRIQYLLRGYDFNGNIIPPIREINLRSS